MLDLFRDFLGSCFVSDSITVGNAKNASSLKIGTLVCLSAVFHSMSQGTLQTVETDYIFAE